MCVILIFRREKKCNNLLYKVTIIQGPFIGLGQGFMVNTQVYGRATLIESVILYV